MRRSGGIAFGDETQRALKTDALTSGAFFFFAVFLTCTFYQYPPDGKMDCPTVTLETVTVTFQPPRGNDANTCWRNRDTDPMRLNSNVKKFVSQM